MTPDSVNAFGDLAAYTALPRLTGLVLSRDGARLVAVVQQPDAKGARYASSIWQIPLDGSGQPERLTRSERGETAPAFLPDGALLFTSARPRPDGDDPADDESALWLLPASGEPRLLAQAPGGLTGPAVAAAAGTVVVAGRRLVDSGTAPDDDDDADRRRDRKDRKITAILHTGMPIRHWDHELGDESPRLFAVDTSSGQARDLTPDAGQALHETTYSISDDGTTLVATWRVRRTGGRFENTAVVVDTRSGARRTVAAEDGVHFTGARISPDGRRVALQRVDDGGFATPLDERLQLRDVADGSPVTVDLGDLNPGEWAWSADSTTLYVAGDLHGRGAVLAVDAGSGAVVRHLVTDAVYSSLCPSPDGRYLYALRSAVDSPPSPVRLDVAAEDQQPVALPTSAPIPPLPGTLVETATPMPDGTSVHGWLCLPPASGRPSPVMLWIHGGPFTSYNAWSWRWNPWVAVAHGWAVVMPDPALSTGYGPEWIARAWPHRAAAVWRDVEAVLDHALERPELDAARTACLGASFGGYMTNWVAGHTDRFGAIVTHAGLWALDQQHTTTDGAQWKTGIFGTPAEHPAWYAENSPHHFVDRIRTPMLVVHGNRDYRVPVSEALRLWWDLVSRFDGEPDDLPHRFLQFTGENHWILSPANAQVWYETVLDFCDRHVRH